MSVDADATLVFGWVGVECDGDLVEPWIEEDDDDPRVAALLEEGEYPSDWVGWMNCYSYEGLFIGKEVSLSKWEGDELRDLTTAEIFRSLEDPELIARSKAVYEAVCGVPPEEEPSLQLFTRWW